MQLLGAPTPKRTVVFANGAWVLGLDKGKLTKAARLDKTSFKTTRTELSLIVSWDQFVLLDILIIGC